MGADAVGRPVEERPDPEAVLEQPPGPLHLGELLVTQGEVLGRQRIVVGVDDELPVPPVGLPHLGRVDPEPPVPILALNARTDSHRPVV